MADPRGFEPLASAFGGLRLNNKHLDFIGFYLPQYPLFRCISGGFIAFRCSLSEASCSGCGRALVVWAHVPISVFDRLLRGREVVDHVLHEPAILDGSCDCSVLHCMGRDARNTRNFACGIECFANVQNWLPGITGMLNDVYPAVYPFPSTQVREKSSRNLVRPPRLHGLRLSGAGSIPDAI